MTIPDPGSAADDIDPIAEGHCGKCLNRCWRVRFAFYDCNEGVWVFNAQGTPNAICMADPDGTHGDWQEVGVTPDGCGHEFVRLIETDTKCDDDGDCDEVGTGGAGGGLETPDCSECDEDEPDAPCECPGGLESEYLVHDGVLEEKLCTFDDGNCDVSFITVCGGITGTVSGTASACSWSGTVDSQDSGPGDCTGNDLDLVLDEGECEWQLTLNNLNTATKGTGLTPEGGYVAPPFEDCFVDGLDCEPGPQDRFSASVSEVV